jgi:acid phosphatase type 7
MRPVTACRLTCSLLLAMLMAWSLPALAADSTLVPAGAVWKYLDDGSNQGTAWRAPSFDDRGWRSGPAPLGYGDGDEATVLGYGPDPANKYVTTYFRRSFTITDPAAFVSLTLRVLRDDGAVVYVNGVEVFRSNMPAGAIDYLTPATVAISGGDESTYVTSPLSPAVLVPGPNVIAVELHQSTGASSDVSFDLELIGAHSATVIRGPYLQMATPTSMVVRWRTNVPTDRRVRYGESPASLSRVADGAGMGTEHEVRLTGLLPATRYYYSVGTTTAPLAGDASYVIVTPPAPGTAKPTRIWVIGDAGTASGNQVAVRDAYLGYTGARATDFWLMLGDNAYPNGADDKYQAAVFDVYASLLRQSPVWPALGNHDALSADSATQSGPYYDIFTLPTQGEAGGVASGTEAYYSFDYGTMHVIVLDSADSDRSSSGAMLTWLRADLAATSKPWIIAIWHHPPYTKGSHDSDTETELIEMRTNALPILEGGGVDLVLSGHSHAYERSFLIDGHYGTSTTFSASMKKDGGSGREDGTGPYRKPTVSPAHKGAVYAVAGSSGQATGGVLNHPAMYVSLNTLGSMVLDVNGERLDVTFLDSTGVVRDYFTMIKESPPKAPSRLGATAAGSTRINLAWTDNADNEAGFAVERSTDGVSFAQHGTAGVNATSYTDATAQASRTYWFRVRAINGVGPSGWSNVASVTTPAPPPTLPTAPNGLTATAVSRSQIKLAWTDRAGNESGFGIERSSDGLTFSQIATVGANVVVYLNTGLTANKTYKYRVRAFNAAGNSAYSNTASATTLRR